MKSLIKRLVFGDRDIDIRGRLSRLCHKDLCSMNIKIDSISIIFFLGRWLPFSIAVGITMGVIASLMDLILVNINSFLTTDNIYLFIYPIFVAIVTGAVVKNNHEVAGPGIGFSILHLRTKKYIRFKTLL